MKEEAPKEYQLIDDITTTGIGESDIISVKNNLRNKTAELGGDLVVVDTIEMNNREDGTFYTGKGRAYKLKKEVIQTTVNNRKNLSVFFTSTSTKIKKG